MANRYEAVVVFEPNLSDSDVSQQIEKIETVIKAHDGTLEKQDIWGRRELAYIIQKKSFGIYAVLVFSGDSSLVTDLRRQLRINDVVLRSLIVEKDKYAPDMTRPLHQDAPPFREGRGPSDGDDDAFDANA